MRVALFTPLSPVKSGIAAHIEGLLPLMRQKLDVTVVTSGNYVATNPLFQPHSRAPIPTITYDVFKASADDFDLVVYQLGNHAKIHGYMLDALGEYPGLVFLHDLCLHHAILGRWIDRGEPAQYVAEMRYNYGESGAELAQRVLSGCGEAVLSSYPLIDRILDDSLALIVSNRYMQSFVGQRRPELPVHRVPLHFQFVDDLESEFDARAHRKALGVDDAPVIITLGLTSPHNRLQITLRAFRRFVERHPGAIYLLIGAPANKQELLDLVGRLGLTQSVRVTGWVSDEELNRYMHIADLAVQLRYPHAGGTSYPPILLLGLGVPTIISDIEPMAEIPEEAVLRIVPDQAGEETDLLASMDYLITHPEAARQLGESGRQYIAAHHDVATIAEQFVHIIQGAAEHRDTLLDQMEARRAAHTDRPAPSQGLVRVAGEALAQLGVSHSNSDLLRPIAVALQGLLPSSGQEAG